MFRRVELPEDIGGALFLHSMPGKWERFESARAAIAECNIAQVVCLTPSEEIHQNSPDYARAIEEGVPWTHIGHPVPDSSVPEDAEAFWSLASSVASALRAGENILVHCRAGIGRTGTFAVAVLLTLGFPLDQALFVVEVAGAGPESSVQLRFLRDYAKGAR